MSRQDYIPKSPDAYVKWHNTFSEELANESATFNITANDLVEVINNNNALERKLKAANNAYHGSQSPLTELNFLIGRSQICVRSLVRGIKAHRAYTPDIGAKLGIEAATELTSPSEPEPAIRVEADSESLLAGHWFRG